MLYESAGTVGSKIPVSYDKFPKYLIDATVSSEDNSFWSNPGVDLNAILRSAFIDIANRQLITGASTITQQLVREIIISPEEKIQRDLFRKIREILIALRFNSSHSKKEILTMYLNNMYYGRLSYGIEAAALTYFHKDVSQLSLAECTYLTGLISLPDSNFSTAKKNQNRVLDLMEKNKSITREEAENAQSEILSLQNGSSEIKAPHFLRYVLSEYEKLNMRIPNGVNIFTTLDYPVFELSETVGRNWVDRLRNDHDLNNAALVLLNNSSGEILSMLGGIDYFDSSHSGQVNMSVSLRQPGSALKPVTYATAFMKGYTPATLILDVRKVYQTKKGEGFTPNNYDGRYHGPVLAREALASSLNLPAVEMLSRIGVPDLVKRAHAFGITTLNQEDRYDLSLTLGGGEVTLLDLTNVYAGFARGGLYKPPFAIEKITDDGGKVIYQHKDSTGTPVLGKNSQQIAYLITDILADPKARISGFGEKNPLVLTRPAAAKTGTTTDWHDNWTVGYTPSFTVGVWVGNNDNHAMKNITGIVGAAPIWNQFFEEFLKGKPVETFTRPSKIKEVEICTISGKLPDGLCPEKTVEKFIEGTEPKEKSDMDKKVKIDIRNNLLAGDSCPSQFVIEKTYTVYPPELYSWARENDQVLIPTHYSPLCSGARSVSENSFMEIIYPREKTVFESAPLMVQNQAVVFEVNVSTDIIRVRWFVDGKFYSESTQFPFSASWKPIIGYHTVYAEGITQVGKSEVTANVSYSVTEYKDEK